MILESIRRPETVWFIQCISVTGVVVDLVRVKKNVSTQQTFQRCFNVVIRLIWRRDFGQCQINVEKTFCTSTLEFAALDNVESTLSISTLIWTTLNDDFRNFGQPRNKVVNMTICKKLKKHTSSQEQNNIFEFQIKIIQIEYSELKIFITLLPISRDICKIIFANP